MTKGRLDGKVCIVTGAGSRNEGLGTGRATACLFAREGARVMVVDLNPEAAAHTLAMIEAEGGEAEAFTGDMTSDADVRALAEATAARWGAIDVLVNNIGIGGGGPVTEVSEEEWDRTMAVNVKTVLLTGRHVVPVMAAQRRGVILNLSSISAIRPRPARTAYVTAKGAVISLTGAMAIDHGAQGIRVNCIAPGPIYTPMGIASDASPERRERRRMASLLQIEGDAWDIAHAAVFLASDEARFVTGQTLVIDGGVSLSSPSR